MRNPVKQMKAMRKAKKLMKYMSELKEKSHEEYLWASLAYINGFYNTLGLPDIGQAKDFYPEIKTVDDLEKQVILFKDSVVFGAEKMFGKKMAGKMFDDF